MIVNWRNDIRLANKSLINDVNKCVEVHQAVIDWLDKYEVRARMPFRYVLFPDRNSSILRNLWWSDFIDWLKRALLEVLISPKGIYVRNLGARTPTWL